MAERALERVRPREEERGKSAQYSPTPAAGRHGTVRGGLGLESSRTAQQVEVDALCCGAGSCKAMLCLATSPLRRTCLQPCGVLHCNAAEARAGVQAGRSCRYQVPHGDWLVWAGCGEGCRCGKCWWVGCLQRGGTTLGQQTLGQPQLSGRGQAARYGRLDRAAALSCTRWPGCTHGTTAHDSHLGGPSVHTSGKRPGGDNG